MFCHAERSEASDCFEARFFAALIMTNKFRADRAIYSVMNCANNVPESEK
jgi:hypothetical protein